MRQSFSYPVPVLVSDKLSVVTLEKLQIASVDDQLSHFTIICICCFMRVADDDEI